MKLKILTTSLLSALLSYTTTTSFGSTPNYDIKYTQEQSLANYRNLAIKGDLNAQIYLAEKFCKPGADEDEIKEGEKWANILIEKNCATGYLCIAKLHDHSDQILDPKYHDLIISNYEKAAALGDPYANFMLGSIYSGGSYLDRDDKKAFSFFEKASDTEARILDNLNDMYSVVLAECYYDGRGTEKNLEKAIAHFEYRASLDQIKKFKIHHHSIDYIYCYEKYMLSLIELGNMYRDGNGVQKDEKKAFDLYEKAIIAGSGDRDGNQEDPHHLHPEYINTLSQIAKYYQEGAVTTKDVEKAKKYREIKAIFEEQKKKSPPYPRLSDSDLFEFLHLKEKQKG